MLPSSGDSDNTPASVNYAGLFCLSNQLNAIYCPAWLSPVAGMIGCWLLNQLQAPTVQHRFVQLVRQAIKFPNNSTVVHLVHTYSNFDALNQSQPHFLMLLSSTDSLPTPANSGSLLLPLLAHSGHIIFDLTTSSMCTIKGIHTVQWIIMCHAGKLFFKPR